jgi:hypothetical protein
MLIEVDPKRYRRAFSSDPHPFISDAFIELNAGKVERVVRLVDDSSRPDIGLIAGLKKRILRSPFSAPFGGFNFRHEIVYASRIDKFIESLKSYAASESIDAIEITLPPDIYHPTFNAKTVNSMFRNGFRVRSLEITNWVDLETFDGQFSEQNSREYYRQSLRNGLQFRPAADDGERMEAYRLVAQNRARFGRPIYMSFDDVMNTSALWPTDFFMVTAADGTLVAAAILYRNRSDICYFLFAGDCPAGRPLRAMDHLFLYIWAHYKSLGFRYIDLGISTEDGHPNEGLLRFKESHNSVSSVRFTFFWRRPV